MNFYGIVPDHVTFLNQVTYSGNLVQTELPIERKPNQVTFGWTVLPSRDSPVFPQMQIAKEAPLKSVTNQDRAIGVSPFFQQFLWLSRFYFDKLTWILASIEYIEWKWQQKVKLR